MTRSIFTERYDQFRKMLIDARKAANLTQRSLAESLQRPQSYISKYERGERRLDVIEFFDVADAIGIDPMEFLRNLRDAQSKAASVEDD